MDRRHQVFVSSTYLDLKEERAAVVSALLQMDAFPAGMELFPATDDDAWTLIRRVIDSSDYYLLVIGGKYGSIDPSTEISYTEKEYDYATSALKPVMAFLHSDPDAIVLGKSEKDTLAREKLDTFREKVTSSKHVKFWNGPEHLAGQVALSFASFRTTYPAVGWIRGDVKTSTESLQELDALRKQLDEKTRLLNAATLAPPPGTEHLAQGSDTTHFRVSTETKIRRPGTRSVRVVRGEISVDVSWDEIFSAIGTLLLDEASQDSLQMKLNVWLVGRYGNSIRRAARRAMEDDGVDVSGFTGTKAFLSSDDFGTVLIQLRALGLLSKSERKRSVSDKETYWTLTPFGDQHLTALRAISRASSDLKTSGLDEAEEEEDGSEVEE